MAESHGQWESAVGAVFPVIAPVALFEHVVRAVRASQGDLTGATLNTFQPAGTMTTLDVLQAQDAVNQARLRSADAVVRYNQAQINLAAALGLLHEDQL